MYVVLFVSRNKDNRGVEGFHERKMEFISGDPFHHMDEFAHFVQAGVDGEMCRYYVSVSRRNMRGVRKQLICRLVSDDDVSLSNLDSLVVSYAMKAENDVDKKWLFDFDCNNEEEAYEFLRQLWKQVNPGSARLYKTVHGFAFVADHGFDTRKFLPEWNERLQKLNPNYSVTLKRNAMLLCAWRTNR